MKIENSDVYEDMAASYQAIEMARLNKVLKKYGAPKDIRRQVCEEYFFDSGSFLDNGWIRIDGQKLLPTICFSAQNFEQSRKLSSIETLYTPSDQFSFHEYVFGNSAHYFEDSGESLHGLDLGKF